MERRRIARVEARRLDLELVEPFAIASGTQELARNVLVEVELEDGSLGIGEAAPFPAVSGETQERSLSAVDALRARVVGRDATSQRAIALDLARAAPGEPAARSGIEQAVADALARSAQLPLFALYGGAERSLVTDYTVTARDVLHARETAARIAARGFSTLKIKVGGATVEDDLERVLAVRDAAPAARLLLDANGGYEEREVVELSRRLAQREVSIALFEEPLARATPEALARLRRAIPFPICADESARSARDVIALVRADAVDAVNVKLMKTGLVEARAIVEIALGAGLALMIGGMVESEIAMLHAAHFAAGLGGFAFVDLDTPLFMARSATAAGYPIDGDRIELSARAAGIGVAPPVGGPE